jgi:vanadium chloroperoxidase
LQGGSGIFNNATAQLKADLDRFTAESPAGVDQTSRSYQCGAEVGTTIIQLLFYAPGASVDGYHPAPGQYNFDDESTHPLVLVPIDPNNPSGPKKAVRQSHGRCNEKTAQRVAIQS